MKKFIFLIAVQALSFFAHSFGQITFQQKYCFTTFDIAECLETTNDGCYIMTGAINYEPCLIKTDSIGNIIWSKRIEFSSMSAIGSYVHQTHDKGYIIAGSGREGAALVWL